jgi:hypothetical protein
MAERAVKIVWFDHTEDSVTQTEETLAELVKQGWIIVTAGGGTATAEQTSAGSVSRPNGFIVLQKE